MEINKVLGKTVPLTMYADSKSLFDGIVERNATTKKRLLIDLRVLRESYEMRELTNIVWILSAQNPADAMTKDAPSSALQKLLDNNHLKLNANSGVERKSSAERFWAKSSIPKPVNWKVTPVSA